MRCRYPRATYQLLLVVDSSISTLASSGDIAIAPTLTVGSVTVTLSTPASGRDIAHTLVSDASIELSTSTAEKLLSLPLILSGEGSGTVSTSHHRLKLKTLFDFEPVATYQLIKDSPRRHRHLTETLLSRLAQATYQLTSASGRGIDITRGRGSISLLLQAGRR